MGESVFQVITNAGENLAATFCEKLHEIYAHAKAEVIEFIEELDNPTLLDIRRTLFAKVTEILPQYKDSELFSRRSKILLIEDVYIIGYTVINKLEGKKLKKIIKGDPTKDASLQEDGATDLIDTKDVVNTCAELKIALEVPTVRFNHALKRVDELEDEVSSLKIANSLTDLDRLSDNSSDEEDHQTVSSEKTSTQSDLNSKPNVVKAVETNTSRPNTESQTINEQSPNPSTSKEGFRHTKSHRQSILKGRPTKKKLKVDPPIHKSDELAGNSESSYRIQAAPADPPSTYVVYVGNLVKETSEDDLRAHLVDIGLSIDNIADVFKLNSRNKSKSSFCISLDNGKDEWSLYNPSNWPQHVIIQPFRPKNSQNSNFQKGPHTHGQQNPPPRFQRQPHSRSGYKRHGSQHTGTGGRHYNRSMNTGTQHYYYKRDHQSWDDSQLKYQYFQDYRYKNGYDDRDYGYPQRSYDYDDRF